MRSRRPPARLPLGSSSSCCTLGLSGLRSPHAAVSIRAVGSPFAVMCTRTERELETVESSKAFFSLYEGSLYQHQSAVYRVVEVRPEQRLAYAAPVDGPRPNYITQPVHSRTLSVCKREARRKPPVL